MEHQFIITHYVLCKTGIYTRTLPAMVKLTMAVSCS